MDRIIILTLTFIWGLFTVCVCNAKAPSLNDIFKAKHENVQTNNGHFTNPATMGISVDTQSENSFTKPDVEEKIILEITTTYGDNATIDFSRWRLPFGNIDQFTVQEIQVNKKSSKILAIVHFRIGDKVKTMRLAGKMDYLVSIPTLNRAMHFGETIKQDDITWTKVSTRKVNQATIMHSDDLIGTQPRSGFIKIEYPIHKNDIVRPRDIKKGATVTINYKTDNLAMTAKGKAMEHGYKGTSIRVSTLDNDKTIIAEVTGLNEVSLTSAYEKESKTETK